MGLWRTLRDLIRNDVPIRPHLCGCGRVTTRLPRKSYQAWLTGGFHVACRCGGRMAPIPHPAFGALPGTSRLMSDLTTAPAEDAAGARRTTNPITREDNES